MLVRAGVLLVLLCLTGCRGGKDEKLEGAGDADTVAAAPRREPLTDTEALGVLTAVSMAAAEAARAPLEVVEVGELRRLLNVVRADHEALGKELAAIGDSLQLTPAEHEAAGRIRAAAQTAVTDVAQLQYGTADAPVLQQQLTLQKLLLAVLDSTVLPGMQPSLLQQYAAAMRPTVAAHLQRAQQIELLLRDRPAPTPAAVVPSPTAPVRVDTTAPAVTPPDTGRARQD